MKKFKADPAAAAAKREEATNMLERGVAAITDSDSFRAYLSIMARFHRYSANNVFLIQIQGMIRGIEITHVAAYGKWQDLGYQVRKGEKGLSILAPMIIKDRDEDTREEKSKMVGFRTVSVFAASQCDPIEGKAQPLDTVDVTPLTTTSEIGTEIISRVRTIAEREGLTFKRIDTKPANGYYEYGKAIAVDADLADDMAAKTSVHELAHHYTDLKVIDDRQDREAIAEGCAFVVLNSFGLDTADYSFGYVAHWATDKKVLSRNLSVIQKISHRIIEEIGALDDASEYAEPMAAD
jgi:antirestriction protein ArdC